MNDIMCAVKTLFSLPPVRVFISKCLCVCVCLYVYSMTRGLLMRSGTATSRHCCVICST